MDALQKILFNLLCEFDEICRKHNIIYYLSGGTNLGALRHRGFIPWDDDADVRMSRTEFEKLSNVIDSELKEERAFITHARYKGYSSPIARYTDKTTTLLARGRMADGTPHGIYLDIIILDPMPIKAEELVKWKKLHYVYCELMEYSRIVASRKRDWKYIDEKLYLEYEKKSKIVGRECVLKELEDYLFNIEEKNAINYCMRFGTTWLGITPIEWYGTPREVLFEGKYLYVADKAEWCAFANYGPDWKEIPQIEDRTVHTVFRINDLASGNCEREYFKFIEPEKVIEAFRQYKEKRISYYPILHETYFNQNKPLMEYINVKIDKAFHKYRLNEIEQNEELISSIFGDYIELQLSPIMSSNGMYVPLKASYSDVLIRYLFNNNFIFKANRILEIWEENTELTTYQIHIKKALEKVIKISMLLDVKKYSLAENLIEACLREFPNQLTLIKGYIEVNLNKDLDQESCESLEKYIENNMENYPNDGELLKFYGDIVLKRGNKEQSVCIYEKAIEQLNNGVILLELANNKMQKAIDKLSKIGCFENNI